MKKISILMFAFVAMLCFNACLDDEDPTFILQEDQTEGPLIVTANSSVVLDKEAENNQAFTLVWEDAAYNVQTPIKYDILAAAGGTDFAEPQQVTKTSDRFFSWTIGELNGLAVGLGLTPDVEGSLEIRVISSLGSNGGAAIDSNTIVLTVTPYETLVIEPGIKNLFLVGNATAADWNNDNNNAPVFRDAADSNVFSYTGKFGGAGNQFKFLEQRGAWAPQYGDAGGALAPRPTDSDPDPSPIELADATEAYFKVDVNIDALTYSVTAFDASTSTVYPTIGIIGDSTNPVDGDGDGTPDGWQSDMDMTQSSYDPHIWYIEGIVLANGGAKFRANDAWDDNWGGDFFPSTINGSGENIPVTGGTYDVWFNDLTGSYIFLPQ